jgi:hypothetical protein
MPYIIIDKTILEVVGTSEIIPTITDSNLLIVQVKSLDSYQVRVFSTYPTGEINSDGTTIIDQKWFPGTAFTQAQVNTEVTRQANYAARIQSAISTVISSVNGKTIPNLTAADVRNIVALLMAERDWIDSTGKVAIPTNLSLK